jgi:hypothetical protein
VELEIYGIDSNSGLRGSTNFRARGAFSPHEISALDALLADSDNRIPSQGLRRVRAIVAHHSLSHAGGVTGKEILDYSSRDDLLTMAAKYGVPCILTGHVHDFLYQPLIATYNGTPAGIARKTASTDSVSKVPGFQWFQTFNTLSNTVSRSKRSSRSIAALRSSRHVPGFQWFQPFHSFALFQNFHVSGILETSK